MIGHPAILAGALVVAGWPGASPPLEEDSTARARIRVQIAGERPGATFDPEGPAGPVEFLAAGDFLEFPPIALPIDGFVTLRAANRADDRFRVSYGRAENGVIDLGWFVLEPGSPCTVFVADESNRALAGAAIHAVAPESRFPPRDPDERGDRTILDDERLLGVTDERGECTLSLGESNRRLAITPPGLALTFVEVEPGARRVEVVAAAGAPLELEIRCDSPRLLHDGTVRVFFDLGGIGFERIAPVNEPFVTRLDADRPLNVVVEARGMKSLRHRLDSSDSRSVKLDLVATDLRFARLVVRDASTGETIAPDSLRLGRARAHPNEYPRRVDFAPDWNSFRVGTEEPPLLAAPPGKVDLSISARGRRETIVRGLRFEGTIDEPTPLAAELKGVAPVAGRVLDATTGAPIAGAVITVRKTSRELDDLPLAWRIRGTVGFVAAGATDERGRFRFESSAYEDLVFEVAAPGHAATSFGPFARDATYALELRLDRGVALAGRAEGNEAGDVAIAFEPNSKRLSIAALDADGGFRFDALARGEYVVLAIPDPRSALARSTPATLRALEAALESKDAPRVAVTTDRVDLVVPRIAPLNR